MNRTIVCKPNNTCRSTEEIRQDYALQPKSHLCIPFLGIARTQSQFPYSCVCERFTSIYSPRNGPHISCSRIGRSTVGIKSLTDKWMWKLGLWPRIPFLGIFISNFRYWFFAVWIPHPPAPLAVVRVNNGCVVEVAATPVTAMTT